jgi:hypothetical protein
MGRVQVPHRGAVGDAEYAHAVDGILAMASLVKSPVLTKQRRRDALWAKTPVEGLKTHGGPTGSTAVCWLTNRWALVLKGHRLWRSRNQSAAKTWVSSSR